MVRRLVVVDIVLEVVREGVTQPCVHKSCEFLGLRPSGLSGQCKKEYTSPSPEGIPMEGVQKKQKYLLGALVDVFCILLEQFHESGYARLYRVYQACSFIHSNL
jgi:hypothetical protein